ncbi:MAG: LacI family DNA-binding transcriptional regulator [Salinibacterium amurskyense]
MDGSAATEPESAAPAASAQSSPASPLRVRARLVDVAERSGVTKSVVSRIINNDQTLRTRPETRERVLEVARELGYRTHAGARALSVSRTGAFALLIPDLSNSVYAAITRGAYRRAHESGYVLLLAEDSADSSSDAVEFAELVTSGRVDGLLIASAHPEHPLVDMLKQDPGSVAHVFVNREVEGSERNVGLDMRGATALAVDYLHDFGHSKIGMIAGPTNLGPAPARLEGFRSRMRELGFDSERYAAGAFSERGGYEATLTLLKQHPELTALYASTFGQAVGALAAAKHLGFSVPGDLSLLGYDDLAVADFLDPPLTTLQMPLDALGVAAVDALLAQLETHEPSGRRIEGGYRIVERESVARPRS